MVAVVFVVGCCIRKSGRLFSSGILVVCLPSLANDDDDLSHSYLLTFFVLVYRRDAKKVAKLESQIPYHEGRGNKEEAQKLKDQVEAIWEKARAEMYA